MGEVLAKTLRFCECLAGEERQRETLNSRAETARVHVDLQSRMAAAAHPFVADAIQACEIEDDGQTLRVVVPKFYKIFINEREIEAILLKLGETRALDVIGGYTPKPGATAQQPVKVPPVVVPIQKSGAPRSVLDRAPCARCGGELVNYSDGTGSDCACRRPGLQQRLRRFGYCARLRPGERALTGGRARIVSASGRPRRVSYGNEYIPNGCRAKKCYLIVGWVYTPPYRNPHKPLGIDRWL